MFCLDRCNLGCSTAGCEVREIAQNHQIRFTFSQPVDPGTVDFTTISLKTPTGQEPVGEFVVEGSTITFIPEVRTVGASTFFGFAPNQDYILTLPGGPESLVALRSTAGDPLVNPFTCTMRVTLGIIDIDGQAPRATVVSPADANEIARDSQFVFRFSEVIDHGPFILNPTGPDAPVQFVLLQRGALGDCDLNAQQPPQIFGNVRLEDDVVNGFTVMTFTPSATLPGNRCVDARISGRVRDLAGTAAIPQSFLFRTDATTVVEDSVVETFADTTFFDSARSAGTWGDGRVSFYALGGDGRHGDFNHEFGTLDAVTNEWVFDTGAQWLGDSTAITPAETVNGNYHFTRFVVPDGVKVRFRGAFPARIHVRGECDIRGSLLFGGQAVARYTLVENGAGNQPGQAGGLAGPGGAPGGNGGQQSNGAGAVPANNGSNGGDVVVPAGHAYAGQAPGTGGRGATMFPTSGLSTAVEFNVFSYSGNAANGGSGGGFVTAGSPGRVLVPGRTAGSPTSPAVPAQPNPGGSAFQMLPLPSGPTSDHFSVGGSGGGGGGSHPFYRRNFMAAAAGAGGGGVAQMRIGRRFSISPSGRIENRGGSGDQNISAQGIGQIFACPGGAGSGGTLLIQVANDDLSLQGSIDTSGGTGGLVQLNGALFEGTIHGGNGGDGIYRLESPTLVDPTQWGLTATPTPNTASTGVLAETDGLVAVMSRYYNSGLAVAPVFSRYEIVAEVDGATVTFSDLPSAGVPATPGAAVQFFVQGVDLDPATGEPVAGREPTVWFRRVGSVAGQPGLSSGQRTGFRWVVAADRTVATSVVIRSVSVFFVF